jgi:hypothetical protein
MYNGKCIMGGGVAAWIYKGCLPAEAVEAAEEEALPIIYYPLFIVHWKPAWFTRTIS